MVLTPARETAPFMREKFLNVPFCLFILSCLVSARSARAGVNAVLDEKLAQLYDSVAERFNNNPWFKNQADADVWPRNAGTKTPQVAEYRMMDPELFKNALKSYCVLLESPSAKQVANRNHYAIVNFSQHSGERRLYIYDVAKREFIHNIWTTHGWNSRMGFWYNLSDSGLEELSSYRRVKVLSESDNPNATFFSNRNGSNQSSVGMAIADRQTYFSTDKQWTAMRLTGVDGELNSKIKPRAVVFHEWGYNGETMRWSREAPLSEGCPMLPKSGTYQGVSGTEIAKLLMGEMAGSPVFFYHDRLNAEVNESAYSAQLQTLRDLRQELSENMSQLQEKYEWDDTSKDRYEKIFADKLDSTYSPLISETYQYFKNRSRYYGVEPKNPAACMKALGL